MGKMSGAEAAVYTFVRAVNKLRRRRLPHADKLRPDRIWEIEQNKPSLVVDDLEEWGVPRDVTHAVLLARGVYKWLAVRRDLIRLKNEWRDELTRLYRQAETMHKGTPEHRELVGHIKALEEARAAVRALCHSERWRAPDFDREAQQFLAWLEREGWQR